MWARTENSGKYLNSSWLPSFPGTLSQYFMQSSRTLETMLGKCAGDEHCQGRCCCGPAWCQNSHSCAMDVAGTGGIPTGTLAAHGVQGLAGDRGSQERAWSTRRLHKMPLAGQGQELLGWDEGPAGTGTRSCTGKGTAAPTWAPGARTRNNNV